MPHSSSHLPASSLPKPDRRLTDCLEDPTLFISHELRTPLTSIQGVLGLLGTGKLGELSDEGRRLLAVALENTGRLNRLVTAIERETVASVMVLSPTEIEQLQLENDLHQALRYQQLQLVYQPIMQMKPEQVAGFEVLLRWHHPTKGVVSPTTFIPLAERIGLISQLGLWVLEQACHQLALWQQQFPGLPPISVSVNLSVLQLLQPDLLSQVQRILRETNVSPSRLKLEITETALVENQEVAAHVLSQLRNLGIQIYIDDFGTGYSSLARLQDLPIDALKIDRSFIGSKRWDISEIIIALAAKLGLDVIAEGVETAEDVITLESMGCRYMQGYFFSRPVEQTAAIKRIVRDVDL